MNVSKCKKIALIGLFGLHSFPCLCDLLSQEQGVRCEVEKGPAVVGCCASCARKGCKGVAATCGAVVEPVGGKKAHADRGLHKDHLVLSSFERILCMNTI